MDQDRHPAAHCTVNPIHLGVVNIKLLELRMYFQSAQTQGNKTVYFLFNIGEIRMNCPESVKTFILPAERNDVVIDGCNLGRFGCRGKDDCSGNICFLNTSCQIRKYSASLPFQISCFTHSLLCRTVAQKQIGSNKGSHGFHHRHNAGHKAGIMSACNFNIHFFTMDID